MYTVNNSVYADSLMQCPRALSSCSVVLRLLRYHRPAAADAAGDDERVSTAAWLLAADHVRPRRCRQLPQLHPAASSIEVDASAPASW